MLYIKKFSEKVIIFSVVVIIIDTLISSIEIDGNPLSGWDFLTVRVITSFLGIYLIRKLDMWSRFGLRKDNFLKGVLLGIPLIVMGLASGIIFNIGQFSGYSFLGIPTLLFFTISMFFVGLAEETVYRGLLLNNMLEKWGYDYHGVWKSILFSAAIFGAVHLPNMFFSPFLNVFVQAINATAGGILFSAIYIKTKNILSVIIIHAVVDWFALIMQVCFTGTSIIASEMTLPQAAFTVIAGSLPPMLFAWLYIGKNRSHISRKNEHIKK